MALFVSSFLVLFLETALIRWLPAYVRLLAYFSNFILLASFLGIGVGCLLAKRHRNLFVWFPLLQFAVIFGVDRLRLEVALPSTSTIYFTSGTTSPVVPVESTLLLPLLFVSVAALFVAVAHRMGRDLAGRLPLRAYVINLLGSLAGVAAFAARVVARAAAERLVRRGRGRRAAFHRAGSAVGGGRQRRAARRIARGRPSHGSRQPVVAVLPHHGLPGPLGHGRRGESHLSPVDGAGGPEGILLSVALHRVRRHVRRGADPRRRQRHRCGGGAQARRQACDRRRHRPGDSPAGRRAPSRQAVQRPARHRGQRRRAAFSADDDEAVRPRGVCADRLADRAIELRRRAARKLHVHEGVVRGGARAALSARRDGALQLLPGEMARRSPRQYLRGRVRTRSARPRAPGSRLSRGHARRTQGRRS